MKPYYEHSGVTIYNSDCVEVMAQIASESVDMVLTSPPYDGLRTYNKFTFDFPSIASELWRITKAGGVVVWVVGDETKNGSESLSSFKQAIQFRELGFNLHDTMIYDKNGFRYPFPNRYHQVFEYMFVFSKGSPKTFNPIMDKVAVWPNNHIGGHMKRESDGRTTWRKGHRSSAGELGKRFNIWRYSGAKMQSEDDTAKHPAVFPEALARDHIISWSNKGDLILDPMCGSGTTLKMAKIMGREAIGIDISSDYCEQSVLRVSQEVMDLTS